MYSSFKDNIWDKNGVTIVTAFGNILDDSKRKPIKIWVDKGEFEKWRAIRASVGGMLAWVVWVTCLHG